MDKWQYIVKTIENGKPKDFPLNKDYSVPLEEWLNKKGSDGWELICFPSNDTNTGMAVFKKRMD